MASPADSSRSYLGPGCRFEGRIDGSGSIELHGQVAGHVRLDGDVVVGQRGTAKAELKGARIVVNGVLEGDAFGDERVEVGATGRVTGDIRAPAVTFAEGAVFEGNVEMRAARQDSGDAGE